MVKVLTPEEVNIGQHEETHLPAVDAHEPAVSRDQAREPSPAREEISSHDKVAPPEQTVSDELVINLVRLFKLLSDETRLRVLYYLTQQHELHVRALCDLLHESQPAVSHHLALLREAGLIERRREGKHNYYGLRTQQFSKLLDMLFATMPEGHRRIRLHDYLLSHAPA